MIDHLIILPVLIHLITAVLCILFWTKVKAHKILSLAGNVIAVIFSISLFCKVYASDILVMQAGNWRAPFGIVFAVDTFAATMVLITSIASLAIGIYSMGAISYNRMKYGYFAIFHFLIMGLNGAFCTGDLFNLYVWFEIVIISSFVLLTLGGQKPQMEGAIKYVALNMLASTFFLTAIGILYGLTGSLNMADLSIKVDAIQNQGLINVTAILFFIGFGIKSAVFPLYFWLPSSYHTPPSAIAALFGALLTKVGIYAMFRMFTLIFIPDEFMKTLFIIIAILTMFTGALGAWSKKNLRRLLSYLIVCHIGFFMAGLGMYTEAALAGAIFYMIHDIIIKSNIFMASGIIYYISGSTDFKDLGGIYKTYPRLSFLFLLILLTIAGIPPLAGFWPKIYLFGEAAHLNQIPLLLALIFASFITLLLMIRIWDKAIWRKNENNDKLLLNDFRKLNFRKKSELVGPIIGLLIVSLFLGFAAEYVLRVAQKIAHDLMNTEYYIQAVLGT